MHRLQELPSLKERPSLVFTQQSRRSAASTTLPVQLVLVKHWERPRPAKSRVMNSAGYILTDLQSKWTTGAVGTAVQRRVCVPHTSVTCSRDHGKSSHCGVGRCGVSQQFTIKANQTQNIVCGF